MSTRFDLATRALLFASAAALAIPGSATAQSVEPTNAEAAQPEPAAAEAEVDQGTTGEIVVTARRRNEALQDVPIAVTAYTGEQLERQGSLDITDLADTTPNLTLKPSRGTNSTLTAFIRGVGQQDPVAGFEQGVGIYIDDVYLNRPQASVLDIYDVDRIEVLRGPQGTLYGRNTVGGAVKYVTRRLSNEPTLSVRANIGTYKQRDLIVSGSVPIADGFKVGASVARLTRDGFGKNLTTGAENYDKDIWAARGTIELEPENAIFVRLSGDYTWDNSNARGGHRLIPGLFGGAPVLDDVYDTRGGLIDPEQQVKGGGVTGLAEIEVAEGLKLRSITSYRQDESATPIDFDTLAVVDFDVPAIYENKQFSQEVQLLVERGRLNGLIGFYYLDANALTAFDVRVYQLLNGLAAHTFSEIGTKTSAVFADFSYDLTDQISVSLGGRYTWDKRTGDILRRRFLGGGSPIFGGAGIPFLAVQTDFEGSAKFRKFTPRASISYEPDANNTLYLSYSQGFKGGGFDPRSSTPNAPDLDNDGTISDAEVTEYVGFNPETVNSYEFGYKGSLFDRRLYVAAALFRADYADVQIPGSIPCVSGGQPSFCGVVDNAGKARMQGVEVEANATVARDFASSGDRLSIAGTLGYIDAEYKEFVSNILVGGVNVPTDVTEFRNFQNTPKWTMSGTLDYSTPAFGGKLNANTTLSYRSKTFQSEAEIPVLDQDGYALLDANIVWRSAGGRWSVGLHGKNLTDKQYKIAGYNFLDFDLATGAIRQPPRPGAGLGLEGVLSAFYGAPRQVYLSLGYKF